MNRIVDIVLTDLRYLVAELGKGGGLIGPSVYDTAQVIRFAPPDDGVWPVLDWLLAQQRPDGGWSDPAVPRARDLPTLAAVLALHMYSKRKTMRSSIQAGLAFLRQQAAHWVGALSDDIPVGSELLLPNLLDEAAAAGLKVPMAPYAELIALGKRRRKLIAQVRAHAATPVVHSWEGWGTDPAPNLIDESGGVGHNPAATAAWLRAAAERTDLKEARAAARSYLERASAATCTGIPGVVPTVWPINRFEQSFSLYILLIASLLDHPALRQVVRAQIDDLERALRPIGVGMSDIFLPDGDDSAAALAVLRAAGRPIDFGVMDKFAQDDHFCAYPGELQPSVSVTAHAAHTLSLLGRTSAGSLEYMIDRQLPDGRWLGDKWNGSWLYTTSQVIVALQGGAHQDALAQAADAVLTHEHPDGSWGARGSTAEETAYAILALRALMSKGIRSEAASAALARAEQWMLHQYRPFGPNTFTCWLGKEMYRPLRLARIIELAATLPITEALARQNGRIAIPAAVCA